MHHVTVCSIQANKVRSHSLDVVPCHTSIVTQYKASSNLLSIRVAVEKNVNKLDTMAHTKTHLSDCLV